MKRLSILMAALLLMLLPCGCAGPAENSAPSLPPQSQSEQPPAEDASVPQEVPSPAPHEPAALPEGYREDNLVTYSAFEATRNLELLEEWAEAFRAGRAASVFLFLKADGIGKLYHIYCGGDGTYTVTDLLSGATASSSRLIRRAVDYVFCTDLSDGVRMNRWQYLVVGHTPLDYRRVEYDIAAMPSLGAIGPEEACRLASLRAGQLSACMELAGAEDFFGGGQWFDLNLTPDSAYEEYSFRVEGAMELAGILCYHVAMEAQDGSREYYLVGAEDGLVFLDLRQAADDVFSLCADPNQELIVCDPQQEN